MTSLNSLVRRGDTAPVSPLGRRIAIGLAVITPLLIAGVAVSAFQNPAGADAASGDSSTTSTAPSTAPLLPAAVVNLDQYVDVTADDGTTSKAVFSKLLTTDLTDGTSGNGFSWTLTDAKTASDGLASGEFSAVVTIPSDFSSSFQSVGTANPVQSTLQVQTNAGSSYATQQLANALTADLQASVSRQITSGFVTKSLSAFETVRTSLGDAAGGASTIAGYIDQSGTGADDLGAGLTKAVDEGAVPLTTGAQGLATGLGALSTGAAALPVAADGFAKASSDISGGITLLKSVLADETAASYAIDERQKALESDIAALSADVPTLTPEQIQSRLAQLQDTAAGIRVSSFTVTLGLGVDALGVTALEQYSNGLSAAQAEFAAKVPELSSNITLAATGANGLATGMASLTDGLRKAATGASDLGGGLHKLAGAQTTLATNLQKGADGIPAYSPEQQTQLATVVTEPILTAQTVVGGSPSPAAAIAAVVIPLALWLGAFAVYLLLVPFTRRALDSTASTLRVVVTALAPAALLGLVQAAVVSVVLFAVGVDPARLAAGILFSLLMSLVFVTLHQGLIALLGQAGRVLSIALLAVQIAAAAVILPSGVTSSLYTGLAGLLPLTNAITGLQALLTGGSTDALPSSAAALAVFGLIGLALALVAASRKRSRDVVVLPALPAGRAATA
ncbi:YhgE/Pip family protein [Herbiconiux sp. CPCC 205716]|uniref:YhgE/Pip family protein n=1 Tax=Herbiconiux gentiana TaxID=2970912 RepID=A0ABT2GHY3_9MICO|nr:YhgE/Pip family protein [Herbiconiux gentiana]MCS5715835.1 YhgE/Pip family protein [Herbiconiux gentiana]